MWHHKFPQVKAQHNTTRPPKARRQGGECQQRTITASVLGQNPPGSPGFCPAVFRMSPGRPGPGRVLVSAAPGRPRAGPGSQKKCARPGFSGPGSRVHPALFQPLLGGGGVSVKVAELWARGKSAWVRAPRCRTPCARTNGGHKTAPPCCPAPCATCPAPSHPAPFADRFISRLSFPHPPSLPLFLPPRAASRGGRGR